MKALVTKTPGADPLLKTMKILQTSRAIRLDYYCGYFYKNGTINKNCVDIPSLAEPPASTTRRPPSPPLHS